MLNSTPNTPESNSQEPTNLLEMKRHLENKLREVEDSLRIVNVVKDNVNTHIEKFTSLKKLKKFFHLTVERNNNIANVMGKYAQESLTIAIKVTDVVLAKDPSKIGEVTQEPVPTDSE